MTDYDEIFLQADCGCQDDRLWCADADELEVCLECEKQPLKYLLATPAREAADDLKAVLLDLDHQLSECVRLNNLERLRSILGGGNKVGRTVLNAHDKIRAALTNGEG